MGMKNFEIFTNGDLGSIEVAGQFAHKHAAVSIDRFQDCAAALFVKHNQGDELDFRFAISFYSVLFRLSTSPAANSRTTAPRPILSVLGPISIFPANST
jgi:hypothetical protein